MVSGVQLRKLPTTSGKQRIRSDDFVLVEESASQDVQLAMQQMDDLFMTQVKPFF
jgi:hypothetical protein